MYVSFSAFHLFKLLLWLAPAHVTNLDGAKDSETRTDFKSGSVDHIDGLTINGFNTVDVPSLQLRFDSTCLLLQRNTLTERFSSGSRMQRNAAIFVASYIITRYHKPCHVPRQLLTNPNRLDVVLTYAASIAACKLAAAQNHHIFPPAQGEKQLAHPNDGDSKTVCAILNLHRILISSNILPLRNRSSA